MLKKSILGLGLALMSLKSKSKICGMACKELGCALMTLKSKSKDCGMHRRSRMELTCAVMTLKSKSEAFGMQKRAYWSSDWH